MIVKAFRGIKKFFIRCPHLKLDEDAIQMLRTQNRCKKDGLFVSLRYCLETCGRKKRIIK